MNNIFINNAITNGINAYISKSNNEKYPLANIFELKIIEFLITLYGKISILNPYKLKDADSLKNNLIVYGAMPNDIDKLFDLLNKYNQWLNSITQEKNTIIKEIFEILSNLVILKNKAVVINSEEMKYYEDFFALKEPKINQIVEMSSISKEDVINTWIKAVEKSKQEPVTDEPLLLSKESYLKYGLTMDEVKKLPENKIRDLNKEIKNRDINEGNPNGGSSKEKPWQLVLSSGNGYVDALVLFSIMCTEIMIGIIITVVIGRF